MGDGSGAQSHYDFFSDKFNTDPTKGGQRIATVLVYLNDVRAGGETCFPKLQVWGWRRDRASMSFRQLQFLEDKVYP